MFAKTDVNFQRKFLFCAKSLVIMRLLVCRYCARSSAGPILSSRSRSWVVRTKTDSAELHGRVASNINSRLTYKQIPGSVERHNTAAFAENILSTECKNLFSI